MTTVLTDYFRKNYRWKVYSIYAFIPHSDCILTETDGATQLRLHDRLGFRSLSKNYEKAAEFIKNNQIQVVIIQTSMDVVAKLKKSLDQIGQQNVKLISVLHYSPGTDEFPISASELWHNLIQGKNILKNLAKVAISPFYNSLEHKATVQAYRNAYRYGDLTILLSDSYLPVYKTYASLSETSKLKAIPNSIPFQYTLTEEDINNKQKTALVVGRMVEFPKRLSTILRIWERIEKESSAKDWDLQIVGDGPDLERFKKEASALYLKRCMFVGRQNPLNYYLNASIFLMTSEFEGFPMTLVEAQQMGCVPVAFDSFGSLKEVITDKVNGRIVPNKDIERYSETVLDLMNNSDKRTDLLKNGLESCKKYNQESICAIWKSMFEKLVC